MVDSYIESVRRSKNFSNSNELAKVLPFIEKLSSQQIDNLISAFNENRQVYQSLGFYGDKDGNGGLIYHLNRLFGGKFKLEQGKIASSD